MWRCALEMLRLLSPQLLQVINPNPNPYPNPYPNPNPNPNPDLNPDTEPEPQPKPKPKPKPHLLQLRAADACLTLLHGAAEGGGTAAVSERSLFASMAEHEEGQAFEPSPSPST